jgi:D-erythro-7,8-dihydroneopterin triphosphate epimerase
MKKAIIRITDLLLRAVIGDNEWEKKLRQDVIINIELEYDAQKAIDSDSMEDAFDYKKLKRSIIDEVENSHFKLLESLTNRILSIVMEDNRTLAAVVRVEKPGALRYAKTVSAEMSDRRPA